MKAEDFNKLFRRPLSGSNTWFLVSGATVEQVVAAIEPTMCRVVPFGLADWQDDKMVTVVTGLTSSQDAYVMKRSFDELRFRHQMVIMRPEGVRLDPAFLNRCISIDGLE